MRDRIEQGEYGYQELLPSENTLVVEFDCSRNTVRRAIQNLAEDGYVQSMHGKGVRIIYQPYEQSEFMLSGIESMKEAVARNKKEYTTKALIIDHNYFLKSVVRDLTPEIDDKYLDLKGYNCLAVVSSLTYNAAGIMFEYTQSRHRPDCFVFYDTAHRVK